MRILYTRKLSLGLVLLFILASLAWQIQPTLAQSDWPAAIQISDLSLLEIEKISVHGNVVQIELPLPIDMDQPTFSARLLIAMYFTLDKTPDVNLARVNISYLDQPYLEISASAQNVREAYEGTLDPQTYHTRLEIKDVRPTELVLRDELYAMGINPYELRMDSDQFFLMYFSDVYAEKIDLFDEWTMILNLVTNLYPSIKQSTIYIIVPDNETSLSIQVDMQEFSRYQSDEINLLEFMAGVKTSYEYPQEEQSIQSTPATSSPSDPSDSSISNKVLGTIVCSGFFFLLFVVFVALGVYLIVSKKAKNWGIAVLLILAIPAFIAGVTFLIFGF